MICLSTQGLSGAALAGPARCFRPPPLPRSAARVPPFSRGVRMQDDVSPYRILGIPEDATYDSIMDSYMALSETYAADPGRLAELESAKEKILDDRLSARMSGTLRPAVADSPFDEKPVEWIPPWVTGWEIAQKLFEVPTPKYALKVVGLIMGLAAATWISPNSAGTILLINVVRRCSRFAPQRHTHAPNPPPSATTRHATTCPHLPPPASRQMSGLGFIYNRGTPDVPRDDFGQVGEIRPVKPKPMALTCGIGFGLWMWGYLKAKRLVALALVPASFEMVLRTTFISAALTLAALFVKVQTVFE